MENYKLMAKESPYKELSVLIVDDFEAVTRTLYSAFEQLGFKTILKAKDGKEAIYRLEHNVFDIIVSDWKMPKMDGLELLRFVRKSEAHKTIPFIMLTGNLHQSDVVDAIEAGVSEYLIKPFSMATLSERVHKAFVSPIPANTISRNRDKEVVVEKETKRTILVVDDEPSNLQVFGELLKPLYKIRVCRSGAQAIDICSKPDKPDLILLDIMMPEMDGLSVCRALKANPETEFIPIIFVSALSQTDDVVKGLKLGAVDYITKPVVPEIVLARVEAHMNAVVQRQKLVNQVEVLIQSARMRDDADQTFLHDVRNPLTAIMTTLMNGETTQEDVEVVKENSAVIGRMLENHSILMELEQGLYSKALEPVTAENVLQKVASSFKAKADEKQIRVILDVDPAHIYQGDDLLSYTMFCNLISNAIEAAPNGTRVTVKSERKEDEIIISVHNVGEVPINIRGQFFNKFVTSGKIDGMGIGAYSAKLCAQAQNGRIKLNIKEGVGTTLILHLKVG
ncbi:ATP-binding response regulator [Vibrio intestinalis]|uniref:ATP-binding response regulator n=1 Tax=Vibrio intestinalis TaxID=2933291 RepID=UPI0021A46714|nr:response regulator [Vibrio intestinalis]